MNRHLADSSAPRLSSSVRRKAKSFFYFFYRYDITVKSTHCQVTVTKFKEAVGAAVFNFERRFTEKFPSNPFKFEFLWQLSIESN